MIALPSVRAAIPAIADEAIALLHDELASAPVAGDPRVVAHRLADAIAGEIGTAVFDRLLDELAEAKP